MRWPFCPPRRATPPHMWTLALRLLLWFGLTASSSHFLFTAHKEGRWHPFSSHEPLFRADDLGSQRSLRSTWEEKLEISFGVSWTILQRTGSSVIESQEVIRLL